jgi:hypothetical protein
MSQNGHEQDKETRLDRLERIVEVLATVQADMQVDIRALTSGQVVMTEGLSKPTVTVNQLGDKVNRLSDKIDHLSDNVHALVHVAGELVRWRSEQERKPHS